MTMLNAMRLKDTNSQFTGAQVAKWIKHWPTDLAVPGSSPTRGELFSTEYNQIYDYSSFNSPTTKGLKVTSLKQPPKTH